MRQALARPTPPRARQRPLATSRIAFLAAPTQGWDTETPISELPQERARTLDNWLPDGVAVRIRKGIDEHATGLGAAVETLMPYNAGATQTLFGAAGTSVYDVTSAGAVGAAVLTSMGNARFSHVNFTTSGGSYLWICNGSADPRHWNGSAWAVPALSVTTYTDNDIFYVWESKQRLFFLFKNSMTFGYLPADSVAGTVSNFALGSVFQFGGRLVAGFKLSRDAGDGLDDYTGFLTSEGEVAIYQGSNPASADEWARVGTYYCGEPIGDRPIVVLGGDIGIITVNGLVSVLGLMAGTLNAPLGRSAYVTERISTAWRAAVAVGRSRSGWEGLIVPSEGLLLLNAPDDEETSVQFVRHQATGAPCRFIGWNFMTFEVFDESVYAGGIDGAVYKCFVGYNDNGIDITASHDTAWTGLGSPLTKTAKEARALLTSATSASIRMVARTDFRDAPPLGAWPAATITNALIWGSGDWGEKLWGGEDYTTRQWRAVSGEGHNLSLVVQARTSLSQLSVNGYQLTYELGGAR